MTLKKGIQNANKKLLNLIIIGIMIVALFSPIITTIKANPQPPSNLIATTYNRFGINLSWTNDGVNNTYIEWNDHQTWNRGDGVELYNGTYTSFNHSGLTHSTPYYYQAWSYNISENNFSLNYDEADAITNPNQQPSYSNENPVDTSNNIDISQQTVSVDIGDLDGDLINWTIEGKYFTTNSANQDTTGTKEANTNTPLPFNSIIKWYINTTDGYSWNNQTYEFTTRNKYTPNPPNPFTATTYNRTQIDLAWTKEINADTTYIEWNSIETWNQGDGNFLYNSTEETKIHNKLNHNTKYYYQAWSWNLFDKQWSATSSADNATTDPNIAPTVSNPYPANNSFNIEFNPDLEITVNDAEGDMVDVFWYSNSSGPWILFATDNDVDTSSGSVGLVQFNSDFDDYSTKYWWSVNCFDGTYWTNETYNFKRSPNIAPTVSNPYPANNSENINKTPICNFTVNDANKDTLDVYIYENTTHRQDDLLYQVNSEVDDGYYYDNTMYYDNKIIINYHISKEILGGLRFRNVEIPLGAEITSANLEVYKYQNFNDANCKIFGDDVDNSEVIEGGTSLNLRTRTTASITWKEKDISNLWIESPDISDIIQEIVNRPGWASGNNITIITKDFQSVDAFEICAYDLDEDYAAKLYLTYITNETLWTLKQVNNSVNSGDIVEWGPYLNASSYNTKYWWNVNVTDGIDWTNETYNFTTAPNNPPTINDESPPDYAEDIDPNPVLSVQVNDLDGESLNVRWYSDVGGSWELFATNNSVDTTGGAVTLQQTNSNFDDFETTYWWNISADDGNEIVNSIIFQFTTRAIYIPNNPDNFNASAVNSSAISLTWDKGNKADYTRIQRKIGSYPTSITDGITIFNDTTDSYLDDLNLLENTRYYYRAWSWNQTDHKWSTSYANTSNITKNKPTITNPVPINGAYGILLFPQLNITINDLDGDKMTIKWYSNSSGSWNQFGTNNSVINGTYYQTNSNFSEFNTKYWWNVIVTDQNDSRTSDTFYFTTNNQPIVTNPTPNNNSLGVPLQPLMNVTIFDPDGDTMNVKWYSNSSGTWKLFSSNSNVNDGTYYQIGSNFSEYSTTYWWKVTVDDGKSTSISYIYKFTTNYKPTISNPIPNNNSVDIPTIPQLSITISDFDADTMNIRWYSNSSGSWELFDTNNTVNDGTYSQINSNFSDYNKKYWWGVNVTDESQGWTNKIYSFITEPNLPPTITNEKPTNGSIDISINSALEVTVDDKNNDTVDVYWYSNSSDSWVSFAKNSSVNTRNGPVNIYQSNSNFTTHTTMYWWRICCFDGNDWTNETYHFTTAINNFPIQSSPYPVNDSSGICRDIDSLYVTVNDSDGDIMDVIFRTNASGIWSDAGSNISVYNGTYHCLNTAWINSYSTRYYWSVNLSDGFNWTNITYSFLTNYKPLISYEGPTNGSLLIDPKPVCNVTVYDEDGGNLDVYFYESASAYPGDTKNYQIINDVDDGFFWNTSMENGAYIVPLNLNDNEITMCGLRFRNVEIPQNAEIITAYIAVYPKENLDDASCTIYGDYTDNSELIEGGTSLDDRTLTSANVEWNEDNLGTSEVNSPDISLIIQEIVNRPGWSKGNNISIITDDTTSNKELRIDDYQNNPSKAAKLIVIYSGADWILRQKNIGVQSGSNVIWNKYNASSSFDTKYWWSPRIYDGCSWTNNTYNFITREQFIPIPPTNFSAKAYGKIQINLSWNNSENNTYIEWNDHESWAPREGNVIVNSNEITSYKHKGLNPGTRYYYQAWGYNTTDKGFSLTYLSKNAITDVNSPPLFTNVKPEDNLININPNYTAVSVDINDLNGETFNWTIEGKYLLNNLSNNDLNGTKTAELITPLPYNTKILWYVNATDGWEWTNKTFNFTVRQEYIPNEPTNFQVIKVNRTQIDLTWESSTNNTYIEWNSEETWELGTGYILENSSENVSFAHTNLNHGTQYFYQAWRYNSTDNVFSNLSVYGNVTTDVNHAPKFSNPNPINGTEVVDYSFNWITGITDADNDPFNWTIECNNSLYQTGILYDTNGLKELSLSDLSKYTTYTIWVNATDGFIWTRKWYKFTTKSGYDHPPEPTNLIATTMNRTHINLTWNIDSNNNTYIEWYHSKNWARGDGNLIVNSDTDTSFDHINILPSTKYFYQAWAYNPTLDIYSNYVEANATTDENHPPSFGTPSPSDGAINQPISFNWSILITDYDFDKFDWSIECNNSEINSSTNDNDGLKQLALNNLGYNTRYRIWVNATDGFNSTNFTYKFRTRVQFPPEPPSSMNAFPKGNNRIELSWEKGTNADRTYIRYKAGTPPTDINNGKFLYNGTQSSLIIPGLSAGTTYGFRAWSWNDDDKVWSISSTSATAKTDDEEGDDPQTGNGDDGNDYTPDLEPPTAPTNVRCTSPESDITPTFSWNPSADESGIKSYFVKIDSDSFTNIGNKLTWTSPFELTNGEHVFYVKAQDFVEKHGDPGSCSFTINTTKKKYSPYADPGGPYWGLTYKDIEFDGSGSRDPDGSIVSGIWDFGDGVTGTGTYPTHNYTIPGDYIVTLTITDNDGFTNSSTTIAYVQLDSDRDGWSDDLEESYGTDGNDSKDKPLDTDGDGIPDDTSMDRKYLGDIDDDNDGLRDDYEDTLGSDPKNNSDVIAFEIDNITYYLVDIEGDSKKDVFFSSIDGTTTKLGYGSNGKYLIDIDDNGEWEYIYNPADSKVSTYKEDLSEPFIWPSWTIYVVIAVVIIIALLFVVYLFKTGYFYVEFVSDKDVKKKKPKKKGKKNNNNNKK